MKKKVSVTILIICLILSNITLVAANGGIQKTIDVLINVMVVKVNGQTINSDNLLYNGTTYLPLRAVSEALGANVNYIDETRTVEITLSNATANKDTNTETGTGTGTSSPADSFPLHIYSYDGKEYLGKLVTNEYDADSIWNEYGTYGSKYQTNSVWNTYGNYGSKYSNTSAFNSYATEPPKIVDNKGNFVGYLTTNKLLTDGYPIEVIIQFLTDNNQ